MAYLSKKIGSNYAATLNFDGLRSETTPTIVQGNADEMTAPENDPPTAKDPSTTVPSQLQITPSSAQTFNQKNPAAYFHTKFTPNPFHTAMCDSCNKKNSGQKLLQRCNTCNRQWCERCIPANDGNHPTNYDHYDWKPQRGLQPPRRTCASRSRSSTKRGKSSKAGYTPTLSHLADRSLAKVTKTNRAAAKAVTRAAILAASGNNKRLLRLGPERSKSLDDEGDNYEGDNRPCSNSLTDEDPINEEYIREIFDRPHPYAPGSMYGRREYESAEYDHPGSMYMASIAPMVPSMGYDIPQQPPYIFHHYATPPPSLGLYLPPHYPDPYPPFIGTYLPPYHPAPAPSSIGSILAPSYYAPSPIASSQSKIAAFRYTTQMVRENDTTLRELRARGKEDIALETFETTVKLKSAERGISEEDAADIFQRATGAEMNS